MKIRLLLMISLFSISLLSADEFVEDETTTLGGYGELHYDMEANDGDGKLDLHRFIFYIKHQFNANWSLMSEIEIEHNMVYSDGDGGYLAMEQAYLQYASGNNWGFRGGVLLIPAGITNEFHEPPTFMSVERPEYNKYIIPTTWFDNGFAFYGNRGDVNWNFTMTGDLDGDSIGDGIRSARKKGVYSKTTDWTKTLQLSWAGIDGLKVGGSVTMNDAPKADTVTAEADGFWSQEITGGCVDTNGDGVVVEDQAACTAEDATNSWSAPEVEAVWNNPVAYSRVENGSVGVVLNEFNATYSKNNIYTRLEYGSIDYTDNSSANSSSGYYLDLGYNIADLVGCDDSDLYVWTRMSSYNKDDDDDKTENNINLFGITYKPADNIAFKLEMGTHEKYADHDNNPTTDKTMDDADVMRLGLGYMF